MDGALRGSGQAPAHAHANADADVDIASPSTPPTRDPIYIFLCWVVFSGFIVSSCVVFWVIGVCVCECVFCFSVIGVPLASGVTFSVRRAWTQE